MSGCTTFPADPPQVAGLRAALARDCAALADLVAGLDAGHGPVVPDPNLSGSALDSVARLYGLTPVERGILCLAAGADLDPTLSAAIVAATGAARPDVSLALKLWGAGAWDALCPAAPLRRARLLAVTGTGAVLHRDIACDERMLNYLMGLSYLETRLDGVVRPVPVAVPAQGPDPVAERIVAAWSVPGAQPVLLLASSDPGVARAALCRALADLGLTLLRVAATDIPADAGQRHQLAVWLDRELALSGAAVLIDASGGEAERAALLADLLAGPVSIACADPAPCERSPRVRIDVPAPEPAARRAIWADLIGDRAEALGPGLDRLAGQFALDGGRIAAAVDQSLNGAPVATDILLPRLWEAAKLQGRRRLDGLAERIEARADWDDLVLPRSQKALLQDLAVHVREAWNVNESWGWAAKSPRGLGAAALFAGPSGTGKTFAAEALASQLQLDLYRVDLSQIVSKYIGETEKNLSRIFAAAQDGGAILLFDEADALFGKRSEVKDSHDRYANVEVSYLLQQMEAYRGLAILTTNQKSALDTAFLRRLRYVVSFAFPDAKARAAIWARIFPAQTPVRGLEPEALATMTLSGGSIRSVALNASFLASAEGGPVTQAHILSAAQREFAKLEKPMPGQGRGARA